MITQKFFSVSVCAGSLLLGVGPAAAEKPEPAQAAEAVVHSFNAAFARKDIEGLVAHFVDGGVQFDLRPAHADQTAPQNLTQELKERWYGVTPILFAATKSYTRTVQVVDSRASADMATVWTKTTAAMVMPDSDKASSNTFTEVYMLVRTPQGWKIGAMMDNRETDTITTAPPSAKAKP
jgi:ketosteroid isomerase-like protein